MKESIVFGMDVRREPYKETCLLQKDINENAKNARTHLNQFLFFFPLSCHQTLIHDVLSLGRM